MKLKKLILLLALAIFIPINVFASDGETEKLFINIDVQSDGSIYVKELAKLEGSYNGRLRNIAYKNTSADKFTGKLSDFEGSDIYNGSQITDLKIYDVNTSNPTFNDIFDLSKRSAEYTQTNYGSNGSSGIFIKEDRSDGYNLKIFTPSSLGRSFYMEYKISNVVVTHNDVAEIAWNILGDSYEDNINEMEVHVNLPGSDNDERVWLRGPLNGEIRRKDTLDGAIIKYNFLGARNAVSFRIMFNKDLVAQNTKYSGVDGREKILEVEKIAADKANAQRNKIKLQNNIVKFITVVWYIVLLVLTAIFILKKIKCDKTDFNQDYMRDFPADYGPEVLSYLIKGKINEDALSASILMLIQKKSIEVEPIPDNKKDYILRKHETSSVLSMPEQEVLRLLFEDIGSNKEVKLSEIKKYGKSTKNANKFMKRYNNWLLNAKNDVKAEKLFLTNVNERWILVSVCCVGILIFYLNIILDTAFIPGYLSIFFGIISAIIAFATRFKTEKGALQYKQWMAMKKFMLDFGTMDEKELPEVSVWGKYLVYATIFGIANKLEKVMKIKIQNMKAADPTFNTDFGNYNYVYFESSDLTSAISNSVTHAVSSSRSSIASSSSSSSGGFGGGSSSGGGSFGGGGGGGHF